MADSSNDVWSTVKSISSDYFDYAKTSLGIGTAVRTASAPSGGAVYTNTANPFPGTQGSYPQAEAKPAPGGAGLSSAFGGMAGLLLVAVLLALVFLRRR